MRISDIRKQEGFYARLMASAVMYDMRMYVKKWTRHAMAKHLVAQHSFSTRLKGQFRLVWRGVKSFAVSRELDRFI